MFLILCFLCLQTPLLVSMVIMDKAPVGSGWLTLGALEARSPCLTATLTDVQRQLHTLLMLEYSASLKVC